MSTVSDLKLWNLGVASATDSDLSAAGATRITGTIAECPTDDLLVETSLFRVNIPTQNIFNIYFKYNAIDGDTGIANYSSTNYKSFTTDIAGDTSNSVTHFKILANTSTMIKLLFVFSNANETELTFYNGSPTIEIVCRRKAKTNTYYDFTVGATGNAGRFTINGLGQVLRDLELSTSTATETTISDNHYTLIDANSLYGLVVSSEYKPTSVFSDTSTNNRVTFRHESTPVGVSFRQWLSVIRLGGFGGTDVLRWTGETPYVGAELLTNTGFETDLSSWSTSGGTWTRDTSVKKFGSASVKIVCATGTNVLSQNISTTIGTRYAATSWVRTSGMATGDAALKVRRSDGTSYAVGRTMSNPGSLEWTLITTVFTAVETTHRIHLQVDGATAGEIAWWDGVSVVALPSALDCDDSSLWSGTNVTVTTVDGEVNKAIKITSSNSTCEATTSFSPQDWSRFRFITLRLKSSLPSDTIGVRLHNATTSTYTEVGTIAVASSSWTYYSVDISGYDVSNITALRFVSIDSGKDLYVDSIRLSEHNIVQGTSLGMWHNMEDLLGAWLKFDDNTGTTAADSSGTGVTATLVGGTLWAAGKFGYCVDLDGVDDTVTISADSNLDTDSYSVSLWINPDTIRTQGIVRKNSASYWRLFMNASGTLEYDLQAGEIGNIQTSALSTGTWYHIVLVYSGVSDTMYLYKDGVLAGSASSITSGNNTTNASISVGFSASGTFFDGKVDEFRMYRRALGPDEVAMLYNNGTSVRGWIPDANTTITLSTDKKEGNRAMQLVFTGAGEANLYFQPQDWSRYKYLSFWGKLSTGSVLGVNIYDQSGGSAALSNSMTSTYSYEIADASAAGIDLTTISRVEITSTDRTAHVDKFVLVGDTGALATNHLDAVDEEKDMTYTIDVAAAGYYRFGFASRTTGGVDAVTVSVGGTGVISASTTAINTYKYSDLVHLSAGSNTVQVVITDADKDVVNYTLLWVPMFPSASTQDNQVNNFVAYVGNKERLDRTTDVIL